MRFVLLLVALFSASIFSVVDATLPVSASILGNNLIEKTCKRTPYYDLCVWSLINDPKSFNADVKGLAIVMIHALEVKASHVSSRIKKLIENEQLDPKMEAALASCAERYDVITYVDVSQAFKALRQGDYKFAETGAYDAASEAKACEESFPDGKSPLTAMNAAVHNISVVVASIVHIVLLGSP